MTHADPDIAIAVDDAIAATIAAVERDCAEAGPVGDELVSSVSEAAAGGKRMRAHAVVASYRAHGGEDLTAIAAVGAALELFQAAALVHDDVLDDADTRRGRPTSHLAFAAAHAARGDGGDEARFGMAGAILAGDLALVAAFRALELAELGDAHAATRRLFGQMTELVTVGQYLDMRIAARPITELGAQLDDIRATMRSKTASYTAEFPLALGAAAAGASPAHVEAARAAGLPAGIAFQLRDDLLGLVGEPAVTGKGVGGDIREGKRTLPLWHAWTATDDAGRETIARTVGRPHAADRDVTAVVDVVVASGAVAATEKEIAAEGLRAAERVAGLDIPPSAADDLSRLLSAWGLRKS